MPVRDRTSKRIVRQRSENACSLNVVRAASTVKALLNERHVPVLETAIIERSAFRDIFDCGGTLYSMDATRVSNLDKAQENARAFAEEMMRLLPVRLPASARLTGPLIRRAA